MFAICSNTIDWNATGAMLQGVGALVGTIAVIVGTILGTNAWKKQKKTERKAEQAERILTATFNAKRALSYIRSPLIMGNELMAAEMHLKKNGDWDQIAERNRRKAITAQVYYSRLNDTQDAQRLIFECQAMARALFNEKTEKNLGTLHKMFWTIKVAVEADYYDDNLSPDSNFRKTNQSTFWEGYPDKENNTLDNSIEEIVQAIENICIPALRLESDK